MSDDRRDIETRADCEQLVRAFYGRALTDPMIGWIFTDVAKLDLEQHVPTITSFWETMLLGARSYGGGAFAPHADIHFRAGGTRKPHFERWLILWRASVDELFAGDRAEEAKAAALRVGAAFHRRLQTLPAGDELPPAALPAALSVTQHGAERA